MKKESDPFNSSSDFIKEKRVIVPERNEYTEEFLRTHMIYPFGSAHEKEKKLEKTPNHITTNY